MIIKNIYFRLSIYRVSRNLGTPRQASRGGEAKIPGIIYNTVFSIVVRHTIFVKKKEMTNYQIFLGSSSYIFLVYFIIIVENLDLNDFLKFQVNQFIFFGGDELPFYLWQFVGEQKFGVTNYCRVYTNRTQYKIFLPRLAK